VAILLEVVLDQTYAGQACINRWNYLGTGNPASVTMSFALANALGAIYDTVAEPDEYPPGKLMWKLALMQHTGVTFNSLTVKDVYSATDFFSVLFVPNLLGQAAGGQGMSPIDAYGFYTNRVRSDIKRATKRFAGVNEAAVDSLGLIAVGFEDELTAVAHEMTVVKDYDDGGNLLSFAPCVVKRIAYPTSIAPDGGQRQAYKYRTEETQFDYIAEGITWDFYPQVRSQTSRQYGKGR
jgi:hypothetical protein